MGGTGKYKDFAETKTAIEASGAHVVTVAVRRVNITDRSKEGLFDYIDPKNTLYFQILQAVIRQRMQYGQRTLPVLQVFLTW